MSQIACTNCHRPYPETGVVHCCPNCGGLFDDFSPISFHPEKIEPDLPGMWRYWHTFGFPGTDSMVSLGEGNTPLIWDKVSERKVAFKLEYLNPTGSFKDRGSSLLVSFLKAREISSAVEDSSGNAGASFAAYAARGGIQARVFVPDSASGPKRIQIEMYGAEVVQIRGPRSNATEAALEALSPGVVYASHAYLPFNLPGYATVAYELVDQIGDVPGTVIVPVGQGGLMLGLFRGFQALLGSGQPGSIPHFVGVQARACAPLWAISTYGLDGLRFVSEEPTLAEGIRVRHPVRGDTLLKAIEASDSSFLAVDEVEILPARDQLARRGFYVEPTSAVVWPALKQIVDHAKEPIVAILTGTGFKFKAT
jgi:threonine synthase